MGPGGPSGCQKKKKKLQLFKARCPVGVACLSKFSTLLEFKWGNKPKKIVVFGNKRALPRAWVLRGELLSIPPLCIRCLESAVDPSSS
jgi:hypothetical protein